MTRGDQGGVGPCSGGVARRRRVVAGLAGLVAAGAIAAGADDRRLADFEGDTYAGWTAELAAFGQSPLRPVPGAPAAAYRGYAGRGLASSAADPARDRPLRGALRSPVFTIEHDHVNFLLGGGDRAFRAGVSLVVDGQVVRTSSGRGDDTLRWTTWDVRAWRGRPAWIGLYDQCIEDEHGYVLVDEIVLSDRARAEPSGDVAMARRTVREQAVAAIRRNAARAAADPWRPVYHYTPPAQRMNDPNGPAWFNGWHHVFYQHMVFEGSGPAIDVHWGHARSRDLVHWETLPLAMHPLYEYGELSCFSGNLAWDGAGRPVQMVTMVPYFPGVPRQIWPARPLDPDWIAWERSAAPPAGLVAPGDPRRDLKDAFPFAAGDRRFLVLTDRTIPIFEARDAALTQWTYRGHLDEASAECPNFFPLDGKWMYLASPHQPVRYRVGDFDPAAARFTPQAEGRINHDAGFYASTAYPDDRGRTILLGVSRGQKSSPAWTGALSLPRILSLGPDGRPRMRPVPALASLRGKPFRLDGPLPLRDSARVIAGLEGDTLEIEARFRVGDARAFGLRVRRSADGRRSLPVMWREGHLVVARETPAYPCAHDIDPVTREVVFRVFLDKGLLDVCTGDGRVFESRVHQAPLADLGVEVFATGGTAELVALEAWPMAPARIDHAALLGRGR